MSVPSNLIPVRISNLPAYGGADNTGYIPYVLNGVTYVAQLSTLLTASSGTVTSVNASGGTTGLTFSGGPVTGAGTLTLAGTLAVANGGTGVTSLGAGVATWLGTPSSANLAAAVTDETGSGALVFANTPTLVTPILGTPTSGTLTNCTGYPVASLNGLGAGTATWLVTPSSANLASAVTDETGTGALVFANTPTLVTPILGTPTSGTLTNATGLPISTGVSGLAAGIATFLGTPSSANLITAVTDETGTGALVFANTPTLITPILGTPTSGTLTNATGLPISTGVSGLGAGVATFLATPSSANLGSALTDKTGTGVNVFATTPTLVTPVLGVATATSINKVTITAPATSATLTLADGSTLVTSGANSITLTSTGATNVTLPTTGTLATLAVAETLSNKNIQPRVVSIADGTSITMNADTTDMATQTNTQGAGTLTVNAPTGTPVNGQKLMLRISSTSVQTFSWNAAFLGSTDLALPTASTSSSKYDYMGFQWNSTTSKWQILAKNFGF